MNTTAKHITTSKAEISMAFQCVASRHGHWLKSASIRQAGAAQQRVKDAFFSLFRPGAWGREPGMGHLVGRERGRNRDIDPDWL